MPEGPTTLTIREVTSENWADFEALFESRGAPKYCWCSVWRGTRIELKDASSASRKRAMRLRVDGGTPIGLLAYSGGVPIAWCSVAPRETFRKSMAPVRDEDAGQSVWSLTCFFVTRANRSRGIMARMVEAAKAYALERGATVLEAYPVGPDSPSYRFGGFLAAFEKAGFVDVDRAGTRRHVVRCQLS